MEKMETFLKEVGPYIVLILAVIMIKLYVVTPIKVNGTSMDSTLKNGDFMILNKLVYHFSNIKRFDIVVIKTPRETIIKRIIGLPGDTIEYKNSKLYVNGKVVKEEFIKEKTEDFNISELGYSKVPEDTYFVLGDNRDNSIDSRFLGFMRKDMILGRAKFTFFPFTRIGNKK